MGVIAPKELLIIRFFNPLSTSLCNEGYSRNVPYAPVE